MEKQRKKVEEQLRASEKAAAELREQLELLGGASPAAGPSAAPLPSSKRERTARRFNPRPTAAGAAADVEGEEAEPNGSRQPFEPSTHMKSSLSTLADKAAGGAGAGPSGSTHTACALGRSRDCGGGTFSRKCTATPVAGGEPPMAGCAKCCKIWRDENPTKNKCKCPGHTG